MPAGEVSQVSTTMTKTMTKATVRGKGRFYLTRLLLESSGQDLKADI